MREIGTKKLGSHIMNSLIKRPRIPVNWGIGFLKRANFQSHICEMADKKTAYNEVHLYRKKLKRRCVILNTLC
jgi:hypothetical protein